MMRGDRWLLVLALVLATVGLVMVYSSGSFTAFVRYHDPNYFLRRQVLRTLRSEKRIYNAGGMPMTEAAIDTGFFGDRYVSIGEPVSDKGVEGAWAMRIYIKPFVDWIWGGAFLMALGGFIAMTDRRYRLAVKQKLGALGGAARA